MKGDIKSNIKTQLVDPHATLAAAANRNSASVDLLGYSGVTFLGTLGTVVGAGALTLTLQTSDDNTTFVAEPDTLAGNSVTVVSTGTSNTLVRVECPNPRRRYARVNGAATVAASDYSITAILGDALTA